MCVSGTDTFPDINHICQFRTKKIPVIFGIENKLPNKIGRILHFLKLDFALCEEQKANWNPSIKRKAFFAEGSTQTFPKYLIYCYVIYISQFLKNIAKTYILICYFNGFSKLQSNKALLNPKERPEKNQGSDASQGSFISAPVSQVTEGIWQIF